MRGETPYFVFSQMVENSAYDIDSRHIKILMKNGSIKDIVQASDLSNLEALSKKVQKYSVSYPKKLRKARLLAEYADNQQ